MEDNQMDTNSLQVPAANEVPPAHLPAPGVPQAPEVNGSRQRVEDEALALGPANAEKVTAIDKMLNKHLPKFRGFLNVLKDLQTLKQYREDSRFGEKEILNEVSYKLKKTKQQLGKLQATHENLEEIEENRLFEYLMGELDHVLEGIKRTAGAFQNQFDPVNQDAAVLRVNRSVETGGILLTELQNYLETLLEKLQAGADGGHNGGSGGNDFDEHDDHDDHDADDNARLEDNPEDLQNVPQPRKKAPRSNNTGNGRGNRRGTRGGRGSRGGKTANNSNRNAYQMEDEIFPRNDDFSSDATGIVPKRNKKRSHQNGNDLNFNGDSSQSAGTSGAANLVLAAEETDPNPPKRRKTQTPGLQGSSQAINLGPEDEGAPPVTPQKHRMTSQEIKKVNQMATLMCLEGVNAEEKMPKEVLDRISTEIGVTSKALPECKVQIDPSVQPVDHANYRGLNKYSSELITPDCTEPEEENGEATVNKRICKARFTGPLHVDLKTVTAEGISKIVKEKGASGVYTALLAKGIFPKIKTQSGEVDTKLYLDELKSFEEKHGYRGHVGLEGIERLRSPATVLNIGNGFNYEDPTCKDWMTRAPLSVYRGILEERGFDSSQFTPEALLAANPDAIVRVSKQLMQPTNQNIDRMTGLPLGFEVFTDEAEQKLSDYVKYFDKTKTISEEGRTKMEGLTKKAIKTEFGKVTKALLEAQKEFLSDSSNLLSSHFAVNIAIEGDAYKKQNDEIAKLPDFLQPKYGMLASNQVKNIDGVTSAQVYIKVPGCRTHSHVENSNLGSFNANVGKSPCVWFVAGAEHAGHVAKLFEESGKPTGKKPSRHQAFWPLEEKIREAGIPIQTVIQRPGDVVHVAPGSFHWVESLGHTVNVSWNVGQLTNAQLQSAAIYQDDCIGSVKAVIVPLEDIVWDLAEKKEFGNCLEMAKTMKAIMVRSLARSEEEWQWVTDKKIGTKMEPDMLMTVRQCEGQCKKLLGNARFQGDIRMKCFDCKGAQPKVYLKRSIGDLRRIFNEFSKATHQYPADPSTSAASDSNGSSPFTAPSLPIPSNSDLSSSASSSPTPSTSNIPSTSGLSTTSD